MTTRTLLGMAVAVVAIFGSPAPGVAQAVETEWTLDEAVARALASHRPLEATRAEAQAALRGASAAEAERWPTLGLSAGGVYSDDPVAVFGTRLRQQRFTQADFDVAALNDPDALGDWNAGLQARWSPLDFSRDSEIERSRILARAAEAGAERQAEVVVYRTRALYASAVMAEARLSTATSSLEAARATRDIVARRVDQGFLMERDLLRTEAALAGAIADSVRARASLEDARDRLGLHLALGPDTLAIPFAGPEGAVRIALDDDAPAVRSDVEARRLTAEAARAGVDAARRSRLPSIELTGAVTAHAASDFDATGLFGTVGLAVQVPLFTSGRIGYAVDRADAMARAADLRNREAIATAEVELREARRAVQAAEAAVEAATRGAEAAVEARRLTRLRLDQGLATPDEALQADADAARSDAMRIDALINLELSRAALDLARGGLPDIGDAR
ncbi:MAG TPA: TolC family protein [Longimicrobiales bacterium]|nr:TolC family protein [Longimicrobiales bacterium]